ncbi:L-ribulose-5-phosphate 4-epimerase [Mammaliicoccus stepanovicii]|uniref:L-ribulose-5-phosphate 4-epimerase n=1 Tax=Mammaliicoccus stepanovicii TaxID=643214 RepID=A0A240AF41_9STAP|nr:L-ribulose-5-phosphate 4-epimerase [Mammaliicoccus stepanovicii]PNZ77855.1 L-ribulose-5-phosphate 4-epimerase [Mammaliicoccus stepanovicii]GGI43108.1 L-ribulose-5-phosphate 4-epimerase [Mammaliicoccus stepanovicii]SNV81516.1 L-ribulose-5-phosphate 4-epimerase [Mammaliicoccus stepanovicii]
MTNQLTEIRKRVYEANISLQEHNLIKFTWGNVSEIDRQLGLIVIKPSGVAYDKLTPENMVVVDINGNVIEGDLNPSSDLPTHIELYKAWPEIGGIVHTHSTEAVGWAQAGYDIPYLGTTHADYFYGSIPCTRALTEEEVEHSYEKETGTVIVETFDERNLNPMTIPGVVVRNHGPFTWGKNAKQAIYHAVVLEEVAKMNRFTKQINHNAKLAPQYIMDKHYLRKHGANAYYGQKEKICKNDK